MTLPDTGHSHFSLKQHLKYSDDFLQSLRCNAKAFSNLVFLSLFCVVERKLLLTEEALSTLT